MAGCEDSQTLSGIERIHLMLIGKTGSGKSSTANTILGRKYFKAHTGFNSETKECGTATTKQNGQDILVIDTPGLVDTDGDDEAIAQRITQSLLNVAPGPHAIILVSRCDDRFTEENMKVFNMLKDKFGEEMKSYLIVIFVGKDNLEDVNKFSKQLEQNKNAKHVVEEASGRYLLFNNNGTADEKDHMVRALMQQVGSVFKKNGGSCFQHKMSEKVNDTMSKVLNEEVRRRSELIPAMAEAAEIESSEGPAEAAEVATLEKPKPANPEQSWLNRRKLSLENDKPSLAKQDKINRIKEVADLKGRGTVKNSRFGRPPNALQDSAIRLPWGEKARMEKILDSLLKQVVEELKVPHDSGFMYMPDKPEMTLAEKQRLLEDALRKKIITHPEELNKVQREEMENLVKSVGQKIKEGKTKFSLKSIECSIM